MEVQTRRYPGQAQFDIKRKDFRVRTTQKFPLPATAVKKAFSRMMQTLRVVWINHMKKGKALVVKQQDQAVFWIPKADTVLRTGECSSLNNIEL